MMQQECLITTMYLSDCLDHEQQLQRLAHRHFGGRGQKGERCRGTDAQHLQLQKHLRDVCALNFRERGLRQFIIRLWKRNKMEEDGKIIVNMIRIKNPLEVDRSTNLSYLP